MDKEMLTVKEAADMYKVETQTIYFAIRKGRLKAMREGAGWRIPIKSLQEYNHTLYSREESTHNGELIYDKKKGLYSPRQIANLMGVHPMKIYYMLARNYVPFKRHGSMYILDIKDFRNVKVVDGRLKRV